LGLTLGEAKEDPELWGRFVESAAGASLANGVQGTHTELCYWAGRGRELDFVLRRGKILVAVEVRSGRKRGTLPGTEAFAKEFPVTRKLLVGKEGIPVQEFLEAPVTEWVR
jgi:predicted AAA+ superfamily ATPase